MNKEIRGLLVEIIFLIFVMIISIPIYNLSSKNNLLARKIANGTTKGLDVNILQRGDMETTDDNAVIVGGNIPFWRYVNKTDPSNNNAIWKSI